MAIKIKQSYNVVISGICVTPHFNTITEMEEMGREDKINKIHSYMVILLMHLIKQHAEKCSVRSWERYDASELAKKIDGHDIRKEALELILQSL